jgi:hypothetical protein
VREEDALANISEHIGIELEKTKLVSTLKKQVSEKAKFIEGYKKDQSKLVSKGSEDRMRRLVELSSAADKVRGYLRFFGAKEQSLLAVKDEVSGVRTQGAPEALRKMQDRHRATALKPEEWQAFLLGYAGDVDTVITGQLESAKKGTKDWKGVPLSEAGEANVELIPANAELDRQPLSVLEAEITRIRGHPCQTGA